MTKENVCGDREMARKGAKKVVMIIGFTILGIGLAILFGFVVMWLWNWLMPMLFGLKELTYWQAVGIFILAKILFGGIGGSSNDSSKKKTKPGATIRKEIKKEFEKEFDKEFDKKFDEELKKHENTNQDYDELYEKWWEDKGEESFRQYMKNKEDDTEE
ncbi:MAG: hypothetical protein JXN65_07840 [Clostridia bacterium]|nr:hypothetical protein [Clostridia bacterium]